MPFYERGPNRIYYEEVGSGFPLLIIPGGGLNSTVASLNTSVPFNPMRLTRTTFAVSPPIYAMLIWANRVGHWRSTAPGTPTLMISLG